MINWAKYSTCITTSKEVILIQCLIQHKITEHDKYGFWGMMVSHDVYHSGLEKDGLTEAGGARAQKLFSEKLSQVLNLRKPQDLVSEGHADTELVMQAFWKEHGPTEERNLSERREWYWNTVIKINKKLWYSNMCASILMHLITVYHGRSNNICTFEVMMSLNSMRCLGGSVG